MMRPHNQRYAISDLVWASNIQMAAATIWAFHFLVMNTIILIASNFIGAPSQWTAASIQLEALDMRVHIIMISSSSLLLCKKNCRRDLLYTQKSEVCINGNGTQTARWRRRSCCFSQCAFWSNYSQIMMMIVGHECIENSTMIVAKSVDISKCWLMVVMKFKLENWALRCWLTIIH